MRGRRSAVWAGLAVLCAAQAAFAQQATVSGSNTVRWERYDTSGNALASPYPVSTTTGYDEINLRFGWTPSPYDRWSGFLTGVVNDSTYRSPHRGVVPERVALARENGEARIPYRVELGDFFAFTSARTQQRPLKGAAIELQPDSGRALRQSILLFGGAFRPDWHDLRWSADNSIGVSWLGELPAARIGVNVLRNSRESSPDGTRTQQVASVTGDGPFSLGSTRWRWEAELAGLRGDREAPTATNDGRDRHDRGAFAQLSGSDAARRFEWRVRGERYGADYRPFGAPIVPDRRSEEAHLAWNLPAALTLRLRAQDYRDDFESSNPLDTRVFGANLAGPLGLGGATINADLFRQRLERGDRSLDQTIVNANATIAAPIGGWLAQLGAVAQDTDDALLPGSSPRLLQGSLALTRPVDWAGWRGIVGPGVVWRDISGGPTATRDLQATLALALANGPHRVALNAGRLAQDASYAPAPDVATVNFAFEYRYRRGRHELGVDYTAFDRRPSPGEKTEAYRLGVQWTFYFDAPAPVLRTASAAAPVVSGGAWTRDLSLVATIAPGADLAATRARLQEAGLGGGSSQPGAVVYEAALLPEAEGRQRLALLHDHGNVDKVALVISLDPAGGPADAGRAWDRVLRAMVERFGRPAVTYEDGSFGPSYANDLLMGRLVRAAEWRLPDGVLRAGIPRRLDGVVRIEVQHARTLPDPRDAGWGADVVR